MLDRLVVGHMIEHETLVRFQFEFYILMPDRPRARTRDFDSRNTCSNQVRVVQRVSSMAER